ncbi:variable large family protein (plasmid) [Borrelia parkeri]|uniref:variable large family protein n=1 Tax=Borrelia parkeri TaxID=141 RepID=UPI001FF53AE3|nr:variable large family protein [Borrelia parkeri]UPA11650.1 variable large family protein [Borrelia parkeri]
MMKRITFCALLMTLFLLISCGSGSTKAEDPKTTFLTSIANLGKGFLDVFTSLSDMVSGAFGIKADTKKSDIGKYFSDIETTMNTVKKKLQTEVATNGNYSKLKSVVDTFITGTLDKIAEGAKTAGEAIGSDNNPIANVATGDAAGTAGGDVANLVKGIKSIVDIVLQGKGNPEAGTEKKADGLTARNNNADGEAGKLFANDNAGANAKKAVADAAKAVGAVTGADILKAIVKNGASSAAAGVKDNVISAAVSAVTKALNTLTIAIRNTVDSGLKTISEALAAVKQEDKPAEATTPTDAATGGQQ